MFRSFTLAPFAFCRQFCAGRRRSMLIGVGLLALVGFAAGQVPRSPCPHVFQYVAVGRQYEGLVRVPPRPAGEALKLTVVMFITAKLPSSYAGKLSFSSENDVAAENSDAVDFHLNFPSQNPLPTISTIAVNGRTICFGQKVIPQPSYLNTTTVSFTFHPPKETYVPNKPVYYPLNDAPDAGSPQLIEAPVPAVQQTTSPPRSPPSEPRPATPGAPRRPRPVPKKPAAPAEDCGVAESDVTQSLIQNGVPTQKGDWPWLAAMYHVKHNSFFCAGTLVDLTHVVTAAHCLQNRAGVKQKPSEFYVVLGKFNLNQLGESGNQRREVSQVIVHGRYNFTSYRNDIAIVELDTPVEYTRWVRPICLWQDDIPEEKLVSQQAIVVGWGRDTRGNMNTEHPEMARAPIVSLETCRQERIFEPITNEMTLCAGFRDGTGPCSGDSGGALMLQNTENNGAVVRHYLQGIVSVAFRKRNSKECNLLHYAVYTNVNKYLNWLRRFIVETYENV